MSSTKGYDEILSTTTADLDTNDKDTAQNSNDLTAYLLVVFPFYTLALLFNFLTIYSILIGKIYRQYLSNVVLAVICIGALLNVDGHMYLILLRWTTSSTSDQLCSSSIYLRDSGSILIYTHIFILALERILANLKKQPRSIHNPLLQKAHLFLILVSFISMILAFTVPIYTFTHSNFSESYGLCIPVDDKAYKMYINWIYFGFGHPFVWLSCILLGIFLWRNSAKSYSTLIPMNRIILIINVFSCVNLLIRTLFDDLIGVAGKRSSNDDVPLSSKIIYTMNLRDFISIFVNLLIGLVFFVFRPEIRAWLYESMKRFQGNVNVTVTPQRLDIRNELDDNFPETDDGNLHFRSDA
ncbi:unnamed protein product [Adineta ricciae]|uniref:Uncharacterized protein n=1 Tax=Adineta ricciae TaxID=249248 RepID=A0A815Y5U4_ADIRI|nr:unnamed protein product [Adineta ricciae]CAF1566387.1 unnamed protein product [Adineta ricciae]